LGDLKKLLNFQTHFERRSDEIHKLHGKGGLRRRKVIWEGSYNNTSNVVIGGSYGSKLVSAKLFKQTHREVWGTIRWLPTGLPPRDESAYASVARRAVLGLTVDFNTAWQLMPWSWLIDWFSSSGDYIVAKRNTVGAVASDACIMTKDESVWAYTRIPGSMAWEGGDAITRLVTKRRQVNVVPTLAADLPFLDGRKLSILGSLAALRRPQDYSKRPRSK
jgi:hypothetical protein